MNIAKRVEIYIKLRDRRAKRKAAFELEDESDKKHQETIEAQIMEQFNADGTDSLKTEFGTAYRTIRTSATVADWDATLDYVKGNDFWSLLEKRVNKTAVEDFIELNDGALPPGINITRTQAINVRRS